jgi:tetratricopeptide (TPR) repeat protein
MRMKAMTRTVLLCGFLIGSLSAASSDERVAEHIRQVGAYREERDTHTPEQRYVICAELVLKASQLMRVEECQILAEEALATWTTSDRNHEPWTREAGNRDWALDVSGRWERALEENGKIGLGWQKLREMSDLWRHLSGVTPRPGEALRVDEITNRELRSYAWRIIEREATYLHRCGRSIEALDLLDAALVVANQDLNPEAHWASRFYASKLLSQKASILDMIGYEDRAIQVMDRLIALLEAAPENNSRLAITRINRLKAISEWEGSSEQVVAQARTILEQEEMRTGRTDLGSQRVVINLELELKKDREGIAALHEIARQQRESGLNIEAFMAERDAFIARADLNDPALYEQFNSALKEAHSRGDYRSEPRLFRRYGDYLMCREHYADAVSAYRNGLEQVQRFGWISWEPELRVKLASALWNAGREGDARKVLAELEAWYRRHPEVSAERRFTADRKRIWLLLAMGEMAKARSLLEATRTFGRKTGLSELKLSYLGEGIMADAFAAAEKSLPSVSEGNNGTMHLAPGIIQTQAITGEPATTRFYLIPQGALQRGKLLVSGPGAALLPENEEVEGAMDYGVAFQFTPGQPDGTVELPVELQVGLALPVDLSTSAATDPSEFKFVWQPVEGPESAAQWRVTWGEAWGETLVMEAASISASPYHPVPILHTVRLAASLETDREVAFRVVSPSPLRIEYRDSSTGQLIAADENGNGVFTEVGDLYPADAVPKGLPAAAILSVPKGQKTAPVEVWISGAGGRPSPDKPLDLSVELYDGTRWSGAATDVVEGSR